jgi:hypothetical protein
MLVLDVDGEHDLSGKAIKSPAKAKPHGSHVHHQANEVGGTKQMTKEAGKEVGASLPKPGSISLPGRKGKSIGIVEGIRGGIDVKS